MATYDADGNLIEDAQAGYDFIGPDGRTYMVTADRGWNDPSAPGRYGLTAADTALAPDNANPAWMPGDRGVLYDKAPQFDSSSIFDLGPILLAAFMVPAIASSLAAAPVAGAAVGVAGGGGALSEAAIADIVAAEGGFSALPSTGMAGTAAGGGILSNVGAGTLRGAITSTVTGGDPVRGALTGGLTGGLSDAWSAVTNTVDEWLAPNIFDELAFDPMAGQVGGEGIGSTIDSVATRVGDVASSVKDTLSSNTSNMASRLVQSVEDVTSAEGGSGAWPASSGAEGGTLLDKIWKGVTSPQGIGAAINVIGGTIAGMGIAGINRKTMQDKADRDLRNATELQQAKTDQSRANRFTGIIGVRPATTRAPLQRLTGGPVYNERGLIRRA